MNVAMKRGFLLLQAIVLLLGCTTASALTDEEIFREFRFNLINPGARSLGLAGAFISLADDATAAQANPAGLSFLRRSEYFAELRVVDNAAQSSVSSESSTSVDSFVATGTDLDDTLSPSFLSAVTVYERWTMGLSRQELLNIENSTLSAFTFTFPGPPTGAILSQGRGFIDVNVTNINASFGVRVTDHLGLGFTLTSSKLEVDSELVSLVVDTAPTTADEQILEPTLDLRTSIDDSDEEVVFSLGFIYKRPDRWSVGAVYRQGADFTVAQRVDPEEGIDLFNKRAIVGMGFANRFHLPDVFGAGGNVLLADKRLTLALDVNRILYSNLLDGFVPGVTPLTDADASFTVDDVTDYRFGGEYVFPNLNNPWPTLSLRGGVSSIGDSTIRAEFTGSNAFASEEVFRGDDRETHGSIGVGVNLKRYKIDLGADVSDSINEFLVSVIYQGK